MATKTVRLGEELDHFVQQQVSEGRFENASEVVRAGVRLLQDYETRNARLREDQQKGLDDIRSGNVHEYDNADDLYQDIVSRGQARLNQES